MSLPVYRLFSIFVSICLFQYLVSLYLCIILSLSVSRLFSIFVSFCLFLYLVFSLSLYHFVSFCISSFLYLHIILSLSVFRISLHPLCRSHSLGHSVDIKKSLFLHISNLFSIFISSCIFLYLVSLYLSCILSLSVSRLSLHHPCRSHTAGHPADLRLSGWCCLPRLQQAGIRPLQEAWPATATATVSQRVRGPAVG